MYKEKTELARDQADLPAPGEGKRGEAGHIAYLLRQASAAVRQALERGFTDQGLTLPQFNVLTILKAYPGITGADLARITLLTPQTVNVITTNLLKSAMIARAPSSADRRVFTLSLTPAGHERLAVCRTIADAVEGQMIDSLSGQDETVVRRWLVAMAQMHGEQGVSALRPDTRLDT